MKEWIEAMRLRTLPVSVAGVLVGTGYALFFRQFEWAPAVLCLVFAVLAQIASNFANEYYDYRAGLDAPGRDGPRRSVTEGDITPQSMLRATYITLGLACCVGLALVAWGGWWLIAAGIVIALGALAYSTGPWPLSHHGLGEVAVIIFFGIVPVNLTYYVQAGAFDFVVFLGSLSVGMMGANVLIVNNYRDYDDDLAVGKRTLAVIAGRWPSAVLYLINGVLAPVLMWMVWDVFPWAVISVPVAYVILSLLLWFEMISRRGAALNPLLGLTATLMGIYAVAFATSAVLWPL